MTRVGWSPRREGAPRAVSGPSDDHILRHFVTLTVVDLKRSKLFTSLAKYVYIYL